MKLWEGLICKASNKIITKLISSLIKPVIAWIGIEADKFAQLERWKSSFLVIHWWVKGDDEICGSFSSSFTNPTRVY